jgi:hypothetical protein
MDTYEEPSGLSLSSETEAGCVEGCILYIVVGLVAFVLYGFITAVQDNPKSSLALL